MNIRILLFLLTLLPVFVFAQNKEIAYIGYKGYLGGMFIHTGYMQSQPFVFIDRSGISHKDQLTGLTFGLGGYTKIMITPHIRLGTEGYTSRLSYENNSFASIMWGGLATDYYWNIGKFHLFIGNTLGISSIRHVRVFNPIENDYIADETVSVRKYMCLITTPFIGFEYSIARRMSIAFKIDYMIRLSNPQNDFFTGLRFCVGMAFRNLKE